MIVFRYEKTLVFISGGLCYGLLEILWRGYTHPTMLILGGVCFLGLYLGEKKYRPLSLPLRCFAGGVFITSLELVTGSVVNIALDMNVWDYSSIPFNFMGQICLQFFGLWVALCLPALYMCGSISAVFDCIYV